MSRRLRLIALPGLLVLAASLTAGAPARPAGSPFYLVPSPTNECQKVKNCVGVTGPWVVVPAKSEATFLFGCQTRRGFVVGGTDARASSPRVRVWFDANLGAPIGFPPSNSKLGAVLLFHAVAGDGKQGWFQPTIGCVSLTDKSKRSTVAALPGTPPGPAVDLRAENVLLRPEKGTSEQTKALRCPKGEKPVGSWSALSFNTTAPPDSAFAGAATARTVISGDRVIGSFHMNRLFGPLAPQAFIQIGAMCES